MRPDLGGIETLFSGWFFTQTIYLWKTETGFRRDRNNLNSNFLNLIPHCEKLRPDLGGIETITVWKITMTVFDSEWKTETGFRRDRNKLIPVKVCTSEVCEKLRPDLGGIETNLNSKFLYLIPHLWKTETGFRRDRNNPLYIHSLLQYTVKNWDRI